VVAAKRCRDEPHGRVETRGAASSQAFGDLREAARSPANADRRSRGLPGTASSFAYFLNNHHGDGIVSVCCKTELGQNVDRALREPDRFYIPAYIGPRGWVGLRLDTPHVDWDDVAAIVKSSYRLAAPRKLVQLLDGEV